MDIQNVRNSIKDGSFRVSDHAVDEMQEDDLDLNNVLHSVENGEIIEEYPESRIAPSCLIFGNDYETKPVHSVWGYFKKKLFSVLVTVYRPSQEEWLEDNKTRRLK
ncbi:MAG: DUF4258 domain-containing protein [Leptospiraceae bacterium]|nr:DUF4258 domain-containing protein [Leptospiraceae bacterium]MCP5494849.1 DUF4258 domain-containing protein [Leptospiraceae bacterium]